MIAIRRGLVLVNFVCLSSCSRLPSRIPMPKLNPQAAGQRALEQYDTDQDGVISQDELSASLGLTAALRELDTDGDGGVSGAEIAARLDSWIQSKQALRVLPCQVNWRGQPLTDATVRFLPEPFLGEAFRPAEGTTDQYGTANIMHAPEDRPDPDFPQGIRVGFYRVEISKIVDGKERIPVKYNTESILGQEIANEAAGLGQGMLTFDLR